jgi:hypothetical protein
MKADDDISMWGLLRLKIPLDGYRSSSYDLLYGYS